LRLLLRVSITPIQKFIKTNIYDLQTQLPSGAELRRRGAGFYIHTMYRKWITLSRIYTRLNLALYGTSILKQHKIVIFSYLWYRFP
jgi:hypothetical protein